jgi:hypothetical protein
MSASRIVLVLAFVFSAGACHRDRCLAVCQQREKELGCKVEKSEKGERSCKTTCDELHEESPCSAQMRGWEACIVSLSASEWECSGVGQPVPKDTACQDTRAKVVDCISKFPQWPLPKK